MIITIDGPAASGKSSIARELARYYNCYYLNTGLLYRSIAYLLFNDKQLNIKLDLTKITSVTLQELEDLLKDKKLVYEYDFDKNEQVFINGKNVTSLLKDSFMDNIASLASANISVRSAILEYQRDIGKKYSLVVDGRDCGSVIFPYADYKFFLTASLEVRAYRWQQDQLKRNSKHC